MADEKTRLIEFGRNAARRRQARGLGRPETFAFLGFTHACAENKNGRFMLKHHDREADADQAARGQGRAAATPALPIREQGKWLASVVRGHLAYYAVPGNTDAVAAFRAGQSATGTGRSGAAASARA